jgi:hypothetical protein
MWNARGYLSVTAGALLASCAQSTSNTPLHTGDDRGGSGGPAGLYVLRSLAGSPLPVVGNQAANLVVIGDTIRLHAGGTGVETGVELVIDATLPEGEHKRSYERAFDYRLKGSRIEVEFPCPINAFTICAAAPHYVGTLTPEGLELSYALYYRPPLVFERIEE